MCVQLNNLKGLNNFLDHLPFQFFKLVIHLQSLPLCYGMVGKGSEKFFRRTWMSQIFIKIELNFMRIWKETFEAILKNLLFDFRG